MSKILLLFLSITGLGYQMLQAASKKVTCTDIAGKTYNVSSNKLTFRPAVYAVIIDNNKVLLSKNWDGYDFPGGGIKLEETIEKALQREVHEETGLNVTVGPIVLCGDSFFKMPFDGKFIHTIAMYYICTVKDRALSTEFFDAHEKEYAGMAEWINLSAIKNIKFYSALNGIKVIEKAMQNIKK